MPGDGNMDAHEGSGASRTKHTAWRIAACGTALATDAGRGRQWAADEAHLPQLAG